MLVKVLLNQAAMKCSINICYSLVAVAGSICLPRRAPVRCSKVALAEEGEQKILYLLVFSVWCGSAGTDPGFGW